MQYRNIDKQALKENGYTVLSKITIVGTDTVFTEDDYIVDWDYEDYRYVPNTGFIGQFVERILDGNLQNISEGVILEDTEINLQIGIENALDNNTITWYDYGNFLITKVEKTDTTGNYKFESADYTKKFNIPFKDYVEIEGQTIPMTFPTLAMELVDFTCFQAGVQPVYSGEGTCSYYIIPEEGLNPGNYYFEVYEDTIKYINFTTTTYLGKNSVLLFIPGENKLIQKFVGYTQDNELVVNRTELTFNKGTTHTGSWLEQRNTAYMDFTNNDFVIESNQYNSEDTCRKVMQDIAKLAYSWVRIGEDNKVHIDFTPKETSSVDQYDELTTDEYYVSKKSDLTFGPVNKVLIGMSDVEGENLYITSQDYTEETESAIKIYDNNLTNTDELRAIALYGAEKLFGLQYTPIEINSVGHPWLNGDELVKLTNVDDEVIYTYPFNRKIHYAGYIEGVIGAEASSTQNTKYEYKSDIISNVKRTAIIVDKQEQTITALAENVDENSSNISQMQIDLNGIDLRVTSVESTEVTAVTNEYAVNSDASNPPAQSSQDWSTAKPTRGEGEYIWARIKTTYKSGNVTYSNPVNTTGDKGDTGASGTSGAGIDTITSYYAVSDNNTTAPNTWTTDLSSITLTPENKYLWNYDVISYTEGKQSTETGKKVIGVYGDSAEAPESYRHFEGTEGVLIEPNLTNMVKEVEMLGDTEQETTTGKNLITTRNEMPSVDELTLTRQTDGQVIVNGTNTALRFAQICFMENLNIPAGTYTFSVRDNGGVNYAGDMYYTINGTQNYKYKNNGASMQITTEGIITKINFTIYLPVKTYTNTKIYVQLESGSSATSFEKYTNGASPNPDYPQNIDVVSGLQKVDIVGKNLIKLNNANITGTGYSLTINNGLIKTSTEATNNSYDLIGGTRVGQWLPSYDASNDYKITSTTQETYTISIQNVVANITGTANQQLAINTNQRRIATYISPNGTLTGDTTFTLGIGEYIKSIYLWTNGSTTITNLEFNIQLEKGNQATTYETFKGQTYDVNLGKNLLNYEDTTRYKNLANTTLSKIDNGIRATSTSSGTYIYGGYVLDIGTLKGETLTLKATITPSASNVGSMRVYGWTGGAINTQLTLTNGTFTIPSDFTYNQIAILFYSNSNGTASIGDYVDYTNIQLEKGSTQTSYSEYFTPIELCKIGNYQDKIFKGKGTQLFSTEWEQGEINGATGVNEANNSSVRTKDYLEVIPNQHYAINRSIYTSYIKVRCYDKDKNYLGYGDNYIGLVSGNTPTNPMNLQDSCVIYPKDNVYYIRIVDLSNNLNTLYMMSKGDTQETYEPYNSKDKWLLHKEIGKHAILESDINSFQNVLTNSKEARINQTKLGCIVGYTGMLYSNLFTRANQTWNVDNVGIMGGAGNPITQVAFRIPSDSDKTWFTDNETILYYPLAIPTNEEITNSELLSQLKALEKAVGYPGENNLYISSNDLPIYLDLDYWTIYKGESGNGIQSVTELYYVSNSNTAPDKPNTPVTTSSLAAYNTWNLQCPAYTETYKYFYTCSEILYSDDSYGWSDVVTNQGLAIANENAYNAQVATDTINSELTNYVTTTTYDADWTNRKDEIYSYVSQEYTTTSQFGQYQETMQTALSQKADATTISATATQVVNDAISGMKTTIDDIEETFTFSTAGLEIARGGSTMSLLLQNDRLSFMNSGTEKAYMTSNSFVLSELTQFQIGNFKFEVRTNGSLDFKKVS